MRQEFIDTMTSLEQEPKFRDIKWRRRGMERRSIRKAETLKTDYVEKRSCGDRRHDLMTFISHIIFPKGWAGE